MVDILNALSNPNQLSGLDAMFLYQESSRSPMHIGALAIYDPSTAPGGMVRHKDIIKSTEDRLHLSPTFRRKLKRVPLGVDHPYWIDDDEFDIEYHIRHIALPKPGDWRQLCILAARIHARPLDLSKPLWELTIIEGLENIPDIPKGSFAVLSKIHHAAIDGASGVDITNATHSLTPDAVIEPPKEPWKPAKQPNQLEMLSRAQLNSTLRPYRTMDLMRKSAPNTLKMISDFADGNLVKPNDNVQRTRFNSTVSPHRVFDGRVFSMSDIKKIRKLAPGSTVNDVVMSICSGALRKYLNEKNELPKEPLIAMAPISVRSEGEKNTMGNQVSAMPVTLGTHIKDPLARLQFVHEEAQKSKALASAVGAREMAESAKIAPALLTGLSTRLYSRLHLANRLKPMYNTVVTNVPGPQVPLYSNGAKLIRQYGLGPCSDGNGLIHPVGSYCGELTVSFNCCRKMLPDPEVYSACLQASFDELMVLVEPEEKRSTSTADNGAPLEEFKLLNQPFGNADDLKLIKGVGPAIEKKLNTLGIYHYEQIAVMKKKDVKRVEDVLGFQGRITRGKWVKQATSLMDRASIH